jgi:hypothetical protein
MTPGVQAPGSPLGLVGGWRSWLRVLAVRFQRRATPVQGVGFPLAAPGRVHREFLAIGTRKNKTDVKACGGRP